MQICKRIIAMLLALTLTLSCCPIQAFATDGTEPTTAVISENLEKNESNLLDNLNNELKDVSNLQSIEPNLEDNQSELADKLKNSFNQSLGSQDLKDKIQTKAPNDDLANTDTNNNDDLKSDDELKKDENVDSNNSSQDNKDVQDEEVEKDDIIEEEKNEFVILNAKIEEKGIEMNGKFFSDSITDDTKLIIEESMPDSGTMLNIMEAYEIESILDYLVLDIEISPNGFSGISEFQIQFNNPYLKTNSLNDIFLFEISPNGNYAKINADIILNSEKRISTLNFNLEELNNNTQIVLISEDFATLTGSQSFSGTYCERAQNYGTNLSSYGIPSGLEYHCYSNGTPDMNDFAICLNNLKYWKGGSSIGTVNAGSAGSGDWANLSTDLKEKLILLLAYGIDSDSSYARFSYYDGDYGAYAAIQLVAWEWIRGIRETAFTVGGAGTQGTGRQYWSDEVVWIAEELRYLVKNNPDNIDPYSTNVVLIKPSSSDGQYLIALETEPESYPTYGDISITKAVSGSGGTKQDWLFYLYDNKSDANAGNSNWIDYAYTNSSGKAYFYDLWPGTYYVREAPANKQSNNTSGWTLDYTVKSVTVVAGTTKSAGTITNTYSPNGNLSVKKAISPSSLATSTNLSGWVFELYSSNANATNRTNRIATATTNTSGVATFSNLTAGTTYYIREAPASAQTKTTTGWTIPTTVLSGTVSSGTTVSVGTITNTAPKGSLSVTKAISPSSLATSTNLSGWIFELYSSSANATNRTNRVATATTNSSGVATFTGLTHGTTYYVREAPASEQTGKTTTGWTIPTTVLNGTVSSGTTVSIGTITNTAPKGGLSVTKAINGTGSVSGWKFELYASSSDATNRTNLIKTATSDSNGIATFTGLDIGKTYYVREAPASEQTGKTTTGWTIPATILNGTITSGVTTSVGTITNASPAKISVSKTIAPSNLATSANLSGWVFDLYKSESNARQESNIIKSATTNSSGIAYFDNLTPGTYYVREASANRQTKTLNGWTLSDAILTVNAKAGAINYTSAGTVTNTSPGSLSVSKEIFSMGDISFDKNDWRFEIYRSEADAVAGTNYIDAQYSNADGVATFEGLANGVTYFIREAPSERQDRVDIQGWGISEDILSGIVEAGKTASVGMVFNMPPSQINGRKEVYSLDENSANSKRNNWVFEVATDAEFKNVVATAISNESGNWETGYILSAGSYYVREALAKDQIREDINDFVLDNTVTEVTVVGGGNVFVIQGGKNYYTSQNIEKGQLQIKKAITGVNETSATLSGWVIKVYSDANCTVLVDTIVTGANGLATSKKLAPGQYWVKEAPKSQQTHSGLERWTLDSDVVPVTINAGITTIAYDSTSATFTNFYQTGRVIKLTKVAENIANEDCFEQIKDNAMYSLAGAEYDIVVNGIVVETLITDENGLATSNIIYNSGVAGYLIETKAPQGYLLDDTKYPFSINSGDGYCEITVTDIPTFDPFAQRFGKADAGTGEAQGNTSFEGAIFRWDYYDTIDVNNLENREPVRTWYFKTDKNGIHGYDPIWVIDNSQYNSSELYKDPNNSYQLPLGSVKITEIVAPFGYVVFDQSFYATIEQDPNTGMAKWAYTPETLEHLRNENGTYVGEEVQDTTTFGSIEIIKKDAEYGDNPPVWTNFAGIEFTVYNKSANPVKIGDFDLAQPGEACAVLVMDADGKVSLDNIPVGTYEIRETKGNDFYNINTEWIQTFSIEDGNSFGFTCENTLKPEMAPGQIKGFKRIYSTNPNTAIAKQNGWLFEIATDINFTNVVATEVSDKFGNWETGYIFPAGTYYVREALLKDQILSDAENFVLDNTIIKVELVGGESVAALQENTIYTSQNIEKGRIEVKKAVFGVDATSDNLRDWVVNIYSDANCTVLVESLITDDNGVAVSKRLTPGNYWIKEAPKSSQIRDDIDMWGLDESIIPVTVEAGATAKSYTDENSTITNYYGKYIKLIKVSNETDFDMAQLEGNRMYSLEGAEYQIIVDGEVVETLITDENGIALSTKIYTIGTKGVIKETVAPNGYLLDTQEHEFEVLANTDDYCIINVSDEPALDLNLLQFKKIDAITGVAQGNMSFQGAIFRWDYYDNTNWDGEPVATWYFATDSDGVIGYHPEYLAENYNSDNLYISKLDTYQMPLGSIKITEEVAPNGYLVFEEPFYATIEQPAMGEQAKWNFTDKTLEVLRLENGMYVGAELQDIATFGSIEIQKADNETGTVAPGWATFEGIEFTIYNKSRNPVKIGDFEIAQPNEACAVIVVGADGKASLDNIPIGQYEIRETKGNDYYQVNEEWYCVFSVEDGNTFNFICHNTLKPAKISIEKLSTDGSIIAGAKFLLEWSIDGETDWTPVQYSEELKMGYSSSVDADGCIVIDGDGIASFENLHPVIYYRITEVESPNGYQLLKDHIMVGQLKVEDNFEMSYKVINNTVFAMPKTGSVGFINMIPLFIIASLAMFCGIYVVTFDRKRKKI